MFSRRSIIYSLDQNVYYEEDLSKEDKVSTQRNYGAGLPTPRYSIYEIEKIGTLGQDINPLSPIERRRLED